jgi:XTP/dITP diphosphohydrolase
VRRETLVLATSNEGKLREFARLLGDRFGNYVSLKDVGLEAPEETGTTYAANAKLKAKACVAATGMAALADDSGLEVAALDGAPGVHSARYAGDPQARIDKLLTELETTGAGDRSAKFVCVLAYAEPGGPVKLFHGECVGRIIPQQRGSGGFGYDPIFLLPTLGKTMAELSGEDKDRLSHRGRALAKFAAWLDQQ